MDNAADSQCTNGGWRDLNPRKATYSNTSSELRFYEIYDGYFWDRTTSPGTVISTPLTNFTKDTTKQVLIRTYETNSSAKILYTNYAQLEVGIDPIYQSAGLSIEEGTATSGFASDLIGTNTTGVTPNDDNPLKISSSGENKNIEFTLTFKNIKGENLIFDMFALSSRLRASTSGVTFKYGIYNNSTSSWDYIKDGDNNYSMFTYYIDHHVAIPSSPYINEDREYKIKIVTNTMASVFYVELDYLNLIALKDSSFEGSNFGTVSGY